MKFKKGDYVKFKDNYYLNMNYIMEGDTGKVLQVGNSFVKIKLTNPRTSNNILILGNDFNCIENLGKPMNSVTSTRLVLYRMLLKRVYRIKLFFRRPKK